jgi:hypothetical protein
MTFFKRGQKMLALPDSDYNGGVGRLATTEQCERKQEERRECPHALQDSTSYI